MAKTGIAADSTAVIPKSFWVKLNISVLPLTIPADGKECGIICVLSDHR